MSNKLIAAAFLIAATAPAAAQTFPARPMTMVVPFAAGGAQDILGRLMAQRMSEILGQQIVVENIGGAGGMNGSKRVADAAPDGYTMGIGSVGTHAHSQSLYKKPRYNAATDFSPIALIAETPVTLVIRKDLPPNNLAEFVSYAKDHQSRMQFGSGGAGSSSHVGCLVLNHLIGINVTHVPYRGSALATQDLLAGRLDYMCEQLVSSRTQIRAGNIKGIANLSKERSPIMPGLPTALEQGIDIQAYSWTALFLPKGTPEPIVQALNKAVLQSIHTEAVRERILESGSTVVSDDRTTPHYLTAFLKSEIERWAAPIKASGISMD
jgi:tripartite-type tricarboxylate transporter receptor subunit TctC